MSKLVRVEDIIDVVGMQNYIRSLELIDSKLTYLGYVTNDKNQGVLNFSYTGKERTQTTITVDKKRNIQALSCDCKEFSDTDYCPHIALAIKYLFGQEELVTNVIENLNEPKDDYFNQLLFGALEEEKTKVPVNFVYTLKSDVYQESFQYELQVQLGDSKLYQLKPKLHDFLENYEDPEENITFGKKFEYNCKQYCIRERDKPMLHFLKMYMELKEMSTYNYGYYYRRQSNQIMLSNHLLKNFLALCENQTFTIDVPEEKIVCKGIFHDFHIDTKLSSSKEQVRLSFDYGTLFPLTDDYEFIVHNHTCYHLSVGDAKLLRLLVMGNKKSLAFSKEELPTFAKKVLPKIAKWDQQMEIDPVLKEQFVIAPWEGKFYFEKRKNMVVGHIHLKNDEIEFDLCKEADQTYYVYDPELEKKLKETLYEYGFQEKKGEFILEDTDAMIAFLELGMYEISTQYQTMIEEKLKSMKVYRSSKVESAFKIGQDRILSYQFHIDHVNEEELIGVLDAMRKKKKYVRLKSGDYLSLEQQQLEEMESLYHDLGLTPQMVKEGGTLPIFQAIRLLNYGHHSYGGVSLDDSINEYMNSFQNYQKEEIVFSESEQILRDYQKIGVKWMLMIARLGLGGILADEMGLGKSLQTIIYIKHRLMEDASRKFLIVAPTSLVYNWENEWKKFAPSIQYQVIHDTKEKRRQRLKNSKTQIFITSYGTLRNDIDYYQDMVFDTCFIDEAQNIKNAMADTTQAVKKVKGITKFALTGTPIENSILELWSIFDYLMPGYLGSITKFKSEYRITDIEEDKETINELKHLITPFILRRKKCDVLKDLPPKIENNIYVELGKEQKKLYVGQLAKTKREINDAIKTEGFSKSQIMILALLTKLRQLCIDPRLLFDISTIGSKLEEVMNLISQIKENGHKILLFSQFPSALKLLIPELLKNNIAYAYLDGQTKSKERMRLVEEFNQNEQDVFLISLKAGGTGLNLTGADVVIHLDPWWNPQVENQATDRSHRIGQKNTVEVIKMIAKGTIEERIVELQEKKQKLSDEMIDGKERGEMTLSKLSERELFELLEGDIE